MNNAQSGIYERFVRAFELSGRDGRLIASLLVARCGVAFFLLAQAFQHTAALKNFALLLMLLSIPWLYREKRLLMDWQSPIWRGLGLLLAVLLCTAAIGVAPFDSFGELRKHFLPGMLLLVLVPSVFGSDRQIRILMTIVGVSFAARAVLMLFELVAYLPDLDAGRANGRFIKGFALDAGFYIPLLFGALFLKGKLRWIGVLGLPLVIVGMVLVQSRAPVFAALLSIVAMLVLLRYWQHLVVFGLLVALLSVSLFSIQPQLFQRLASAFDLTTYQTAFDLKNFRKPEDGLTERVAIWDAVIEITASRSVYGYGFGWKKLGGIAESGGYLAVWQAQEQDALAATKYRYFSQASAKVNPHSLYLQIYFESGLFGLAAYAFFVMILLWQTWRLSQHANSTLRIYAAIVFAYLMDHLVLGVWNGLWLGLGPSFFLLGLLELVRRRTVLQ